MDERNINIFLTSGTFLQISPKKVYIGYGKRTWLKTPSGTEDPIFYFPDFFLNDVAPWFTHETWVVLDVSSVIGLLKSPQAFSCSFTWTRSSKKMFSKVFFDLMDKISKGDLKKGVPYVFETTSEKMNCNERRKAICSLLTHCTRFPMYGYGFWDLEQGIVGASPELLCKIKKPESYHLYTVACAGTMGNHHNRDSFFDDPKEKKEHSFVIDGIQEALIGFGDVKIGETKIVNLGKLSHLITPIEVDLEGRVDYENIIRALHPTPALGAFPFKNGWLWLKHLDTKLPRGRYGAPVGIIFEGGEEACFYVGIRNVQWDNSGSKIGAGCGIVKDSDIEREWAEIGNKIDAIKEVLSLG